MVASRTFSIIKPDATRRNLTGAINSKIEDSGLRIVAQRRIHMTREQAQTFYSVHAERPFYNDLVDFMTSGPVVVQVLEGENAVTTYREIMGATNPADAKTAQSANYLRSLLKPIPYMVLIAMIMQRLKSLTSFRNRTLSADTLLIKIKKARQCSLAFFILKSFSDKKIGHKSKCN